MVHDPSLIAKRLKEARFKRGISQKYAAEKIGVADKTLADWENGKRYPQVDFVARLIDLYDVKADWMLGGRR